MNKVVLIGRLARDPETRYTQDQKAVTRFTLAVNRIKKDDPADFISCVAFGTTAQLIERYVKKGNRLAVEGHINTGSYEKDGRKIYTTDVIVDRMEFISSLKESDSAQPDAPEQTPEQAGFAAMDDDIPF